MLHLCGCYLRAHKELRASPLKPKVSTWMRSEKSLSFDVWCFSAVEWSEEVSLDQKDQLDFDYLGEDKQNWHLLSPSKLASSTPLPLSDTSTSSAPHSFSLTSGTCNDVNQKCSSHEQLVRYQNLVSKQKTLVSRWVQKYSPMLVAPASTLFSTSSLTAVAKVSTTCPEQIWCTECLSMALMAPAGSEQLSRKAVFSHRTYMNFMFCWIPIWATDLIVGI